ncbi:MAG: hypothetical protein PHE79_01895 [Eubacteriales bacterium]|nr:hypothetical protein [Eubacteriales bacterium]
MKIKCVIDTVTYQEKPDNPGTVTNRMTIDKSNNYSIEDIKKSILAGQTVRPAFCGKKEIEWKSQQMFMIDIDNEGKLTNDIVLGDLYKMKEGKKDVVRFLVGSKEHRTYNQILEHCKLIDLVPSFVYTSFNHKEEQHKFRLVYILDKVIEDFITAKRVQLYLMNAFGESDPSCKELKRFYYGGRQIVFDSGNILSTDWLIESSKDIDVDDNKGSKPLKTLACEERVDNIFNQYISLSNILSTQNPEHSDTNNSNDTYNIKAIGERDIEYLKSKINSPPIQFESEADFWSYVYKDINMVDLLEIKYPKSFRCLFHDDGSPSASIYQHQGVWLYKCWSASCDTNNKALNNKQVIEKLGKFRSEYKAIEFIKDIFNLSIKESEWSIEQKANLDLILHNLNLNKFSELCPQADKNIKYVKDTFKALISIAKENIYSENYMNSDGDVVFFVSLGELAKILNVSPTHINRISQRIAVLVYHDLVRKLDDDKIPEKLLQRAQAIAIDRKTDKRINFYSIPSWVIDQLKTIEDQGIKWKDKGYTVKGTSYEMFYRGEGLEVAQKLYPQHKKAKSETVDYETGEIINTVEDRTTSVKSNNRTKRIIAYIETLIGEKSYATEKELVEGLWEKYRSKTITETQLRKIRGEYEKLGFSRIRANKEVKEKYNMDAAGYPFLIVRNTKGKMNGETGI